MKHTKKAFPRMPRTVYAIYVGKPGKAEPHGYFTTKKEAEAWKRWLKHDHATSLRGAQSFRCIIVAYNRH